MIVDDDDEVDILGTSCDQCRSMVQYSFTSTETRRLVRTDSSGRPPGLSHSSGTMRMIVLPMDLIYIPSTYGFTYTNRLILSNWPLSI